MSEDTFGEGLRHIKLPEENEKKMTWGRPAAKETPDAPYIYDFELPEPPTMSTGERVIGLTIAFIAAGAVLGFLYKASPLSSPTPTDTTISNPAPR